LINNINNNYYHHEKYITQVHCAIYPLARIYNTVENIPLAIHGEVKNYYVKDQRHDHTLTVKSTLPVTTTLPFMSIVVINEL
jgi:hypothetical protein